MGQANLTQHRKYGLDLLRSLSMLFVVVLHVFHHGGLAAAYESGSFGGALSTLVMIAVYPAVDCFVLLSGYLLSKLSFRLSRVIKNWLTAMFWSVVIQLAFYIMEPERISVSRTIFMFLPILSGRYWFVNAYLVMLLVSPFLNRLLRELPQWQMRCLLLAAVAVFCLAPIPALGNDIFKTQNGFSFPWFLVLYLFGGYIRAYCPSSKNAKGGGYLLLYLALCVFQFTWMLGIDLLGPRFPALVPLRELFMKYTSVPVCGSAVCLLMYFRSGRFNRKTALTTIFSRISPLVFSVYLIHEHPLIRERLIQGRFAALSQLPLPAAMLWAAGAACGIFLICLGLDLVRSQLFRRLQLHKYVDQFSDFLTLKIVARLKGDL